MFMRGISLALLSYSGELCTIPLMVSDITEERKMVHHEKTRRNLSLKENPFDNPLVLDTVIERMLKDILLHGSVKSGRNGKSSPVRTQATLTLDKGAA